MVRDGLLNIPSAADVAFGSFSTDPAHHDRYPMSASPRSRPNRRGARYVAMGQFQTHALRQRQPYSITLSARPSSGSGMVRPSALAVLRLMTNSTLVDRCTGRSAGLAPFRILPA